jgi:hypothetical protein
MNADDPWWLSNKRTATHLVCTFACGLMLVTLGSRTPWVWLDCICTAKSIRDFWDTHCLCSHCSASCRDATNPFCFFFEYTPEVLWCFFFGFRAAFLDRRNLPLVVVQRHFHRRKRCASLPLARYLHQQTFVIATWTNMSNNVEQCRTRAC